MPTVTGTILEPNGDATPRAPVRFQLIETVSVGDGVIPREYYDTVTDASGQFSLTLVQGDYEMTCKGEPIYITVGAEGGDITELITEGASFPSTVSATFGFFRVATLAELKTITTRAVNKLCVVLGSNTEGDGGGGTFWWDATAETADDTYINIRPNDFTSEGIWRRATDGIYNICWFGADTTGTSNVHAALTAAAAAGNNIAMPPGTYRLTANLTLAATKHLIFANGAKFLISSGVTLTINGTIQAPLTQIFSGDGTVVIGKPMTVYPEWWGAVGDDETDDSDALQSAFSSVPVGGCVDLQKTYISNTALTFQKNNTKITGGTIKAGPTFSVTDFLISITATGVEMYSLTVDGDDRASRTFILMPGTEQFRADACKFKNCYADNTNSIIPRPVQIAGNVHYATFQDCEVDGANTDHANGIARGYYIAIVGSEDAPSHIKIRDGSIKNITPATDADGISFQPDWPGVDIFSSVEGVSFEECAKRAVKIMLDGVSVTRCKGRGFAYSAVSVYAAKAFVGQNEFTELDGVCGIEVGSTILSDVNDVQCLGNFLQFADDANVSSTGDGFLVQGLDVNRLTISKNTICHTRNGIHARGGITEGTFEGNTITDCTQSAVRTTLQTISSTDYFPSTISIRGNVMSEATATPIICISSTNVSGSGNLYNGSAATVMAFSSCTNIAQSENTSDTDIGLTTTQFDRSTTTGLPKIKDNAVLQNTQHTSIGIGMAAPGTGGGLALEYTGNFIYGVVVDNPSSGTAASAACILRNDLDKFAFISLNGSGFTGAGNQVNLSSSVGCPWVFHINAVATAKIDESATAGHTRFLIYDVDSGLLQRVKVGANGTGPGGTGRALYIDNV